ncbi:UNVERIFIED_CONTAM: hypothetical protein HHA_297700 [Hammondia hammondi]|eukprot:XP_008886090.1 hypothetical protein HHA_297700 [Hammondia hammondi]
MYGRRGSTSRRVRQERPRMTGVYTGIRRTRERLMGSINALRRDVGQDKDGRKAIIRERCGGKVAARVRFPEPLVAREARRRGRENRNRRYRQSKQKVERFNLSSVEVGCKKLGFPVEHKRSEKFSGNARQGMRSRSPGHMHILLFGGADFEFASSERKPRQGGVHWIPHTFAFHSHNTQNEGFQVFLQGPSDQTQRSKQQVRAQTLPR